MLSKRTNHSWWIFIGCSLMVLLVNIDTTVANLALATIAKALHANLLKIQWVINAYLLSTIAAGHGRPKAEARSPR